MSWWEASSFSNLATQAFKTAQQRIDRVLDIRDDEEDRPTGLTAPSGGATGSEPQTSTTAASEPEKGSDDSFWNAYLGSDALTGFTSVPSKNKSVSKPTARTPTPASLLQTSVTTERTELKTSATSAFTVRSKRVESTLKKFNVKSDLLETSTSSDSSSVDLEKETVALQDAPVKNIVEEELGGAGDRTEYQELSVSEAKADEHNLTEDLNKSKRNAQADCGKKSAPLKLGRSLSKKKEKDSEEVKKVAEEKAKAEAALVEAQVASLLEEKEQALEATDTAPLVQQDPSAGEREEKPAAQTENANSGAENSQTESSSFKWTAPAVDPNQKMVISDTGSGWEAEDIDIEELSDIDLMSNSQHTEADPPDKQTRAEQVENAVEEEEISVEREEPVSGEEVPEFKKEGDDVKSLSHLQIDIPHETSEEVALTSSSQVLTGTEPVQTTDELEISKDMDENPVDEAKDCEKSLKIVEDVVSEPVTNVVPQVAKDELFDKLHVSFEGSDTAEGTSDELSESSKTLTGEDFTSSVEECEEGYKKTQENETEQAEITTSALDNISGTPDTDSGQEASSSCKEESEEEKKEEEGAQASESGGDEKKGIALVSSSYVKTMLEEAMVESVKDTDSHTSSSSDKSSEMVRIESGMNSGHTSGDEIDTTTSSDIEIISTPTPNGEYRQERPFDLSPLRHALSRTMRRGSPPGHKRSDSSSSGQSTWSKNGDDLLGPDGGHHKEGEGLSRETVEEGPENSPQEGLVQDMSGTDKGDKTPQDSPSDALETQSLLKETKWSEELGDPAPPLPPASHLPTTTPTLDTIVEKVEPSETPAPATELSHDGKAHEPTNTPEELLEKLAEMAEVLDARERKLLDLSRENIELEETKAILRNQLKQSEEAREAEMEDLNTITEEFTARLADFEQRQQATVRERDNLKKQLNGAQSELAKKTSSSSGLEKLLKEKDQQISELLEEGEKLSKQQLQSNNIIKKLRAKEKDNETLLKGQKTKLEQHAEELAHLRKVLDSKEDLEKRQIEAINQQNTAIKKQESDLLQLKSDYEDLQEKARGLQAALDNSYKEISELHKAKAAAVSENQTARLSVEMQAKQELQITIERQQQTHKHEVEAFITQTEDLQMSIVRLEREQGRREDILRQEISDLQQRLQEAEERNQDLTTSVTSATRPLLRQIENLQSTYSVQSGSYEKLERNLTERLNEAQSALAEAVEKERAANERLIDVQARLTTLETQVSTLRQEKSRLTAHLEVEKTKIAVLEDAKNNETAQLDALKAKNTEELTSLKKEKLLLENQIEMEKMKTEAEKKKLILAHEQLRDKELQLQRQAMTPSPRSTATRDDSFHSEPTTPMSMSLTQEEILEKTLMFGSTNGNSPSLYDSLRHTGAATLLENLQSQLKLKEGEIAQLQSEIKDLEQTRESMARELVNLSTKNEQLEQQLQEYPALKRAHQEIDARYQALLQMYGEKVEEAEELGMDLHDIKDMYKAQIEELLKRIR